MAALQTQVAQLSGPVETWREGELEGGRPDLREPGRQFQLPPQGPHRRRRLDHIGIQLRRPQPVTGTEFRDLRLGAEGNVGKIGYNLEVDFAGNVVSVKEAYISYETKFGGLGSKTYLGNSLNDRSIEGATELVSLPFAERNAVASVAVPQIGFFGLGLQERVFGKGWHVSAAVKGGDNGDNDGTHNDNIAYFGRAHVNPILNKDGFIHLGGWGYYENLNETGSTINKTSAIASDFNDEVRVSASSIANVKADDGYGAEVGAGWHSLWAFGEYGQRTLRVSGTGKNIDQKAWSAYGGWFLTGEKRALCLALGRVHAPARPAPDRQGRVRRFRTARSLRQLRLQGCGAWGRRPCHHGRRQLVSQRHLRSEAQLHPVGNQQSGRSLPGQGQRQHRPAAWRSGVLISRRNPA